MFRKFLLPIIAIIGAVFAIFTVYYSSKKPPTPPIVLPPPKPPYKNFVAGAGLIEAASENIAVGTPFNDIITEVFVKVGDNVKKGDPLFKLDLRTLNARLAEAIEQKRLALTQLEESRKQLFFYESLKDSSAISKSSFVDRLYAVKALEDQVAIQEKNILITKADIERSIISAPIDGQVLQIKARVGESAQPNPFNQEKLVVFGDISSYHVRVDIDEEDSWRILKNQPAVAFVRGNSSIRIPLEYIGIEPLIVPKSSLTGNNQERVDTRVLQLIYRFKKDSYPVYIGQMIDVYIESLPISAKFHEDFD